MSGEYAFSQILYAVWFILPAYLANGGALAIGGGHPLDGSRNFFDSRRILGDGVTIRGTIGGITAGTLAGMIQGAMMSEIWVGFLLGFMMGLGAILGDSLGSFVKRRLNMRRGQPAPGIDQLGFLLVALGFASIVVPVSLAIVIILIVLTPAIHLSTNAIAYQLGMKKVWY